MSETINKKISLKEMKEQIIDLIYEILEEELEDLENKNTSSVDEPDVVPDRAFRDKDFKLTSTGDQAYKDLENPSLYNHKRSSDEPFWPKNMVYTKKREI